MVDYELMLIISAVCLQIDHNTYHMNVADVQKFENKLREAETSLGIPPGGGVHIVYERGTDAAGKILASLVVAIVLISILSRARAGRNPLSMDKFVSNCRE